MGTYIGVLILAIACLHVWELYLSFDELNN